MTNNDIYLVEKENIIKLGSDQQNAQIIGGKALGLCQVPRAWSVPFFIISKDLYAEYILTTDETIIENYIDSIKKVIDILNIGDAIILRSSAVNEGMAERGKFESIETTVDNLKNSLKELLDNLKGIPNLGMPIIVQKYVTPLFTGHLSNERRFSQENRDWKVETYYPNGNFEQDSIGIRTWRKRYNIEDIAVQTLYANEHTVLNELQKVAYFWYIESKNLKCRFHLEFVFDGETIYIVQADRDLKKENSVNPKSYNINVSKTSERWTPKVLKRFNVDTSSQFKKLQNVKNYNDLGFCTVPLYFLDDINTINDLSRDIVSSELKEDIETLLKIQSIVIRMDISNGSKSQKQLLPRSNEIHNYDDVIIWLKEHINLISAEQNGIFIFHNFVPSTSSAFAHALPNNRLVKIQSLWGLPEGLYYNYHDTIIVDLGTKQLDAITPSDTRVTIKNRYKDLFISPDENGNWIACDIKEPYDWKCSIESNESIFDIAVKSQKLANALQEEISVMWFVGIDASFYGAKNLPWFHEKVNFASSYTKDEYKRKYFKEEEIVINNSEELQELISSGNFQDKKCFRLKPNCEKDLRNKDLIANIGKIAAENDIMILLDGTQLTHSYYQLKSTGAKVVCSDKDELLYSDTLEFNKLVRDKIPEKIISNGEHVKCSVVTRPLLDRLLLEKLLEEAYEVNDAKTVDEIISELADLTELCKCICNAHSEYPISCKDVLNNKRSYFKNESNVLKTLKISPKIQDFIQNFKFEKFYGSISIQRKKTLYRIEFNLQNFPHQKQPENINPIDELQVLKTNIIVNASLALKSKSSKQLMNYINIINEYVAELCGCLNISLQQVENKRVAKESKVGGFNNGYVLEQTVLKDNIIDETLEFNPDNCKKIHEIERENTKYFEFLENLEKNEERLLFRFSLPIAVNEWEVVFDNPKIQKMLPNIQEISFDVHKNNAGRLILKVNGLSRQISEQLSFFD